MTPAVNASCTLDVRIVSCCMSHQPIGCRFADCAFVGFDGDTVVHTGRGKASVFDSCMFIDNIAESAVLTAWSDDERDSGLAVIQECIFEGNDAPSLLQALDWDADESPVFFRCTSACISISVVDGFSA
jgi:hypothetical protein